MHKNRFFDASSSEESSDDEQHKQIQTAKPTAKKYIETNDDDKKDVDRIVRSEKEKRYEEIEEVVRKIKQAIHIRDINRVYECFETLTKAYDKARRVVEKEKKIPRFYIKILVQLDDFVTQCWSNEKWRDTLNKTNSNNLSKLRQKLCRYLKQQSFEQEINAYREQPDNEESETDDVSSVNENDEDIASTKDKQEENDSTDDFSKQTDDELTSNPIDDILSSAEPSYINFLKGNNIKIPNPTGTKRSPKEPKPTPVVQEGLTDTTFVDKQVDLFLKEDEITEEVILKKLNELISLRGKRGINYQDQLDCLNILRQHIEKQNLGIEIKIKILLIQITISFDYHQKGNESLKITTWTRALDYIEELLTLLSENSSFDISDDIITIILKMDEEFIKILQNIDGHSQDYLERLKDELRISSIIDRFKTYLESKYNDGNLTSQYLCTVYMCVIEHVYYKYDKRSSQSLMDRLCKFIYANDTLNRIRTRACLCHVYHLALHDYYQEARDLMLMCHMQDTIHSSDISTQILYNRTIVQLGLCAFRSGAIREAHQALVDIQSGNRVKELLGQDARAMVNQEMKLPFHMHINVELIECVYLVSAMLIEIPFMTSKFSVHQKRPVSKHFYILMRHAEKQLVFESPESMREHVISASHAMKTGDWNACVNFLINDKMNSKVWNLMPQATDVRKMLITKIQEESLRTYLFNYATVFDTISILTLADMFELPVKQVYSIICKMIINEELKASLEEHNQTVIMHHTDSSGTQALSLQLVDKIFRLYEQNEKLIKISTNETKSYSRPGQQRNQRIVVDSEQN